MLLRKLIRFSIITASLLTVFSPMKSAAQDLTGKTLFVTPAQEILARQIQRVIRQAQEPLTIEPIVSLAVVPLIPDPELQGEPSL